MLSPDHSIYVSKSTNPYFNLTFEDWLFRHKAHKDPLLLIYRDDPCIVVGRNQNPWKEVNLHAAESAGIPWIRRRSGGGTVFHDLGNTNFSIHLPRSSFDRNETGQIVLKAVRLLGVDAVLNDRNDICVGQEKVSGSAYKIINNRAYHHGTMLISTRLDTLGNVLRVNKPTMETKGVASVRSPVRNLQQFNPDVHYEGFVQAVIDVFQYHYGIREEVHEVEETAEAKSIPYIRDGMAELSRWDWAFGQTPEFKYTIDMDFAWGSVTAKLRSKHGIILKCALESSTDAAIASELADMGSKLQGQKYAFVDESVLGLEGSEKRREVWGWLRVEMSR
ncbi:lipoyltransferase and lipoate-protein ligase [Phanerochaete sordida]|uniref:Putative lipoate-protein ligase A n=1 Tax=Phanerochaete sordida TaxID=48140 RepID=A0A9P3L8D5_9APHY|nr:lipoyltransferase and lipoate-protein ligase [Phanerochaete sordida]